jgi:hypothetical protein
MSMPLGLKAEFEAVIVVLAEAYGAGKKDLVEAARKLPNRRSGPKEINDDTPRRQMAQVMKSTGRARWNVAREFAEKAEGYSLDATARRLNRKSKTPVRTPRFSPTGEPDIPNVAFALAREAIAEVSRIPRQREVNKLIAQRLNRIRRN